MTNILLVWVGVFTTFSASRNETVNLVRESFMTNALLDVDANVILGLLAVLLGRTISKIFFL